MIPYLLMFTISLALVIYGLKNSKKKIGALFVLIGLLLPCIMAGMRNVSVGTDTNGYIYNMYKLSKNSKNLLSFFDTISKWYGQKNYLYSTITYLIGKNQLGFGLLLFVYECLIVFPVFWTFKRLQYNNNSILIGLIVFYFLFYNVTYNMLKQSIAIAFSTLSFAYYMTSQEKKDKFLAYFLAIIACGFHITAIVIIPLFWLYNIYMYEKIDNKHKILISIGIVLFSIICLAFHRSILTFIGEIGIYPMALFYLEKLSIKNFSYYQTFINSLIILIVVYYRRTFIKYDNSYIYILLLSIINLILSSGLGYFIHYSQRIMLYVQYILLFCYVPKVNIANKRDKQVIVVFGTLLIISWLLYFVFKNVHETVPYLLSF